MIVLVCIDAEALMGTAPKVRLRARADEDSFRVAVATEMFGDVALTVGTAAILAHALDWLSQGQGLLALGNRERPCWLRRVDVEGPK